MPSETKAASSSRMPTTLGQLTLSSWSEKAAIAPLITSAGNNGKEKEKN